MSAKLLQLVSHGSSVFSGLLFLKVHSSEVFTQSKDLIFILLALALLLFDLLFEFNNLVVIEADFFGLFTLEVSDQTDLVLLEDFIVLLQSFILLLYFSSSFLSFLSHSLVSLVLNAH